MLISRLTAAIFFSALLAFPPPSPAFAVIGSIGGACCTASRADEAPGLPTDARQSEARRTDSHAASAIAALRQEADGGDAEAQYELGMAYTVGVGVERDPKAAAAWMERAALQGFPAAVADLGVMYLNGDGVPRDRVMACALLTAAVERAAPAEIRPEVACDELSADDRDTARRISVDPTLWQRP